MELALCAAGAKDRKNLAVHFYKSGQPQQDVNGQTAYIERFRDLKFYSGVVELALCAAGAKVCVCVCVCVCV